jgi:archaemetzincin
MELEKEKSKKDIEFELELENPNQNTLEKMIYDNYKKVYDVEYGIYHFRIPTPLLRKASFDCSGEPTFWAKSISHEYTIFYKPIPPPGPNDWLMNHKEYGQTFNEYKNFGFHEIQAIKGKMGNKNLIKKEVIYIAPLNYNINPSFDENFITSIIVFCQSYFHDMQFRKLNIEINHKNVEYRKYEDGSYQINACTLIEKIYKKMPEDAYCLIGITDVDIYNAVRVIKPREWIYYPPPYKNNFCYELNSYKYWVSLCSIARFDPMFSKDSPPSSEEEKAASFFKLLKRSIKMVVKNISHMFGLKNCIFFSCVMNGFGSMKEFDSRPVEICPCCLRKIFTNIVRKYHRLDDGKRVNEKDILIFQRFENIIYCLKENFKGIFDRETEWYEARLNSLKKELYGE